MAISRRQLILLSSAAVALSPFRQSTAHEDKTAAPTSLKLKISGMVEQPLELSWTDLRQQPPVALPDIPVRTRDGALVATKSGYEGIPLIALLDRVRIQRTDPAALKRAVVVAKATDSYVATFSWNELYNSPIGGDVYVLTGRSQQPLDEDEGRIALLSLRDTRTGPRHVRWLNELNILDALKACPA